MDGNKTYRLESQLMADVKKMLRREYAAAWIYTTADVRQKGIPDLIICADGRFYAAELKLDNRRGKHFELQLHILSQISAAGGRAAVCRSVEQVRQLMDRQTTQ